MQGVVPFIQSQRVIFRQPADFPFALVPDFPNFRLLRDPGILVTVFGPLAVVFLGFMQRHIAEDFAKSLNALIGGHVDGAGHPPDFIPCAGGRMQEILPIDVIDWRMGLHDAFHRPFDHIFNLRLFGGFDHRFVAHPDDAASGKQPVFHGLIHGGMEIGKLLDFVIDHPLQHRGRHSGRWVGIHETAGHFGLGGSSI